MRLISVTISCLFIDTGAASNRNFDSTKTLQVRHSRAHYFLLFATFIFNVPGLTSKCADGRLVWSIDATFACIAAGAAEPER